MGDGRKVIVVRKKGHGDHAHHGGSWKVAYADFVTAMMAFFLVMWIMGMDQGTKNLVQGYFENPIGFKRSFSGGRNILSQGNSIADMELNRLVILRRRMDEEERLRQVRSAIDRELQADGVLADLGSSIEVIITDAGLRIELMESEGRTFFSRASADVTPDLRRVLTLLASQLGTLPNDIVVEGHTDRLPFGREGYSNWELSADRANAARRVLEEDGLPHERLMEVRAYADRHLKFEDPYDARNRRISLLLPFVTPSVEDVERELVELGERLGSAGATGAGQ